MGHPGVFPRSIEYREKQRIAHLGQKSPMEGKHHTEEAKKKMSIACTGKKRSPFTEEHKHRISLGHMGIQSYLGKHHTDETKRKIGNVHRGKYVSIETRKKLSIARTGKKGYTLKPFSKEHRENISKGKKGKCFGKNNPFYGKHHSNETKKKLSDKRKLSWKNMTYEQKQKYIKKILKIPRVSKPQRELYLFLKQIFPDAQLEYPITTLETYRFADIGIPSLKIDFEYDGFFKYNQHTPEKNRKRDKELADVNWITFRVTKETLKTLAKQQYFVQEMV